MWWWCSHCCVWQFDSWHCGQQVLLSFAFSHIPYHVRQKKRPSRTLCFALTFAPQFKLTDGPGQFLNFTNSQPEVNGQRSNCALQPSNWRPKGYEVLSNLVPDDSACISISRQRLQQLPKPAMTCSLHPPGATVGTLLVRHFWRMRPRSQIFSETWLPCSDGPSPWSVKHALRR